MSTAFAATSAGLESQYRHRLRTRWLLLAALAVAVLTQCSAPAHLQVLGAEQGLGPLAPMEVAVYRSRASKGNAAVDSLRSVLLKTLRQVEAVR